MAGLAGIPTRITRSLFPACARRLNKTSPAPHPGLGERLGHSPIGADVAAMTPNGLRRVQALGGLRPLGGTVRSECW